MAFLKVCGERICLTACVILNLSCTPIKPAKLPVVCGWPDKVYFSRQAADIILCFEAEYPVKAPINPYHCVTVREIRRQLGTLTVE
jgi:hypothetical protein